MKLVWKYGRLSSILFLKFFIPFWHLLYRNFRSIPFHFPFHSIPCPGCRFYIIIIIVIFYFNVCSQVENPEAPDFEKIASASGFFSTLSLPSSLPLPTSFIKVLPLPLPQKINRFRRFRFHISDCKSGLAFRVGFVFGPGSGLKLTKISGLIRA